MVVTFRIAPKFHLYHSKLGKLHGSDMWYVGNNHPTPGEDRYLSNDGRVFPQMQRDVLDSNGGTYFPTQQDAEECLARYIKQQEINNG